jgi:uncharacterized protein YyaL (SSP411 family)
VAGKQASLGDTSAARALGACSEQLAARFDAALGGFGSAPKFPRPAEINALLYNHLHASTGGSASDVGARPAMRPCPFTLPEPRACNQYAESPPPLP